MKKQEPQTPKSSMKACDKNYIVNNDLLSKEYIYMQMGIDNLSAYIARS